MRDRAGKRLFLGTQTLSIRLPRNGVDPACALPRMDDFLMIFKDINVAYGKSKQVLFSASSEM